MFYSITDMVFGPIFDASGGNKLFNNADDVN